MKWSIITDSSCEYIGTNNADLKFEKVPFIISIDGKDYTDTDELELDEMIDAMEKSRAGGKTACPPPASWYEKFEAADNSVAITISSGVSGSYNSAVAARNMILEKHPEKRICIIDSKSAGSGPTLLSILAEEEILAGKSFEDVEETLSKEANRINTVFALSSFGNLVKNGRMSKLVGVLASALGMWGIGIATDEGKIVTKSKARGAEKALLAIIEDMKERGAKIHRIVITHCKNLELAEKLSGLIKKTWENSSIRILAARGLCSFYAERGGLIVSY